jgi:diguanylate cyclase (GGDEF)-like protein
LAPPALNFPVIVPIPTSMSAGSSQSYADHDPVSTARFAGLVWTVFGAALLAVLPVAASGSPVAIVLGSAAALVAAVAGVRLARGWILPYHVLLGVNYVGVAVLAALQAVAGHDGGALLTELYLLPTLQSAALHPARRAAGVLVAVGAAIVVHESRGGWTTAGAADLAMHSGIWLLVAIIANQLVAQLRAQRTAARAEEALARTLASTDSLTGLGNRRRLLADLDRALEADAPMVLALFDLDGFKAYNDSFGHPAGDALLRKLGADLLAVIGPGAGAYRMGGDEFCLLAPGPQGDAAVAAAASALTEHGEAFTIGASFGAVWLPAEAQSSEEALRIADRRMYAHKAGGRTSAGRQSTDVLLRVLRERNPELGEHVDDVTALCERIADLVGIAGDERAALLQAAALHDVGKAAIPDAILEKPGPLEPEEWAFMHQHTIMGERIMAAAPALTRAAQFVRSSHERVDGAGYPDGLCGEQIPLASRVIAVCDAFDAMTTDRPYQRRMNEEAALAELRRCAGTQFDAGIVEALAGALLDGAGGVASCAPSHSAS